MKRNRNLTSRIPSFGTLASILLAASSSASAQPQYEVIDLGTFGGDTSRASGISDNGKVAGLAQFSSGALHAAMWDQDGNIVDLGSPPGLAGIAVVVNDAGRAACYGEGSPQTYEGYFWEDGVWTPIGMLPGNNESIARDIDSAGRVVGQSFNLGPTGPDRAIIWDAGVLTDLGTLGGSYSTAFGINDVGQVVGRSQAVLPDNSTPNRAFIWENGQMTALEPLPGDVETQAFDINDSGDVVGSSWYHTVPFLTVDQAALWRDGGAEIVDLGYVPATPGSCSNLPRWNKSIARAVNNCGRIVGDAMCISSGASKAGFLWEDGVMHNLNDLIPGSSGWNLLSALDINNAGQIVGFGLIAPDDQHLRAFLLEPLTPPDCTDAPGDVDGDGVVGVLDVLALLAMWGPCADCAACPADQDNDCMVGVTDLLIVLANWT